MRQRISGSVTRIRRDKWKTDGKKKCMGSMQGHDGSGLRENIAVVVEKDPGKCMGRLNWNGKISDTNISQSE